MKKLIYSALLFLVITPLFFDINAKEIKNDFVINYDVDAQSAYAATAYTRNSFGQNYSINLTIYGTSTSYMKSISYIVVNGRKTSFSSVYGEDNTYRFSVGGQTYYFTF